MMLDPLIKLPREVSTIIFSFFTTPQLANFEKVSKSRRNEIILDALLHKTLDLTSLKRPLEPLELIQLFDRLSRLHSLPGREIRLDLSSFWPDFRGRSYHNPWNISRLVGTVPYRQALLTTTWLATKGSLGKLLLVIEKGAEFNILHLDFVITLLEEGVELDRMMDHLGAMELEAEGFPIHLESGDETKFKLTSAEPFENSRVIWWPFYPCRHFLKQIYGNRD